MRGGDPGRYIGSVQQERPTLSPPSLREHVVETVAVAERPLRLEDIKGVFRRRGSELRVSSGLLGRLARLGRLAESGDGLWTTGDGGAERLAVHGRGELRDLSRAVDATLRRNPARKTGWKDALAGDLRRWWRRVLWTGDLDGLAELQAARRRWAPEREEPWAEVLCRPWLPEVARSLPLDVVDTVAHIDLDAVLAGRRDTFDPGWWTWLSEHPRPSPHMAAIAALRAVLEGDPTGAEGWLARAHDPGLHRQVHGLVHLQHGRLDLARDGLQHATFDVTLRLRPLLSDGPAAADGHPLDLLVAVLQAHWQQRPAPDVRQASERMRQLGLHWVAAELSGRSSTGTAALRSLKTPAPDWSRTLQKLTEVAGPSSGADSRIIWRVRWGPDVSVDCTPRLQRRNARGAFSAGRAISVADILAGRVPAADARDHAIAESRVTVDEFSLRFDPDALAQLWSDGVGWRIQAKGGEAVELVAGEGVTVGRHRVEAVMVPLIRAGQDATVLGGRVHPRLRIVANYDTAHIHRDGLEPVLLSGNGARILGELVALDGPAAWEVVAGQIWRDEPEAHRLRRRWDVNLGRLRAKLEQHGVRPDLVRSDGTGNVELVLLPGDEVDDRT